VWVFLALDQIISDGDDKNFEPRGRRREALNAIKSLAQQTGRGWFQHCPCYTRDPDPPEYMRDPCQPMTGVRHGACDWRLSSARNFHNLPRINYGSVRLRGEPYARSNRAQYPGQWAGEPETYRPNLSWRGRGTRHHCRRMRHGRIRSFFCSPAGAVTLRLALVARTTSTVCRPPTLHE
jgi:hypothetical protein